MYIPVGQLSMETLAYVEPANEEPFFLVTAKWPVDDTARLVLEFKIEVTDGTRFWNATSTTLSTKLVNC